METKFLKTDVIISLIVGELTAIYFLTALLRDMLSESLYSKTVWVLPILFPILAVLGLGLAYFIGKRIKVIFEMAKYFYTGVFATIADLVILNFLMQIANIFTGNAILGFKVISFIVATFVKFLANKFWAFKEENTGQGLKEGLRFYFVTAVGLAIQLGIIQLMVNVVGAPENIEAKTWTNISAIIAAFASFVWNFIGYKFFVFRKAKAEKLNSQVP